MAHNGHVVLWTLAVLWAGVAQGDDVAVYAEGDAEAARARLTSYLSPAEGRHLEVVAFADLAARGVELEHNGGSEGVRTCETPLNGEALRRPMAAADKAIEAQKYHEIEGFLVEAEEALGCLAVLAEPNLGARLYLLRGLGLDARGDRRAAAAAFQMAYWFDPELQWDDRLPEDSRSLFLAASKAFYMQTPARLELSPSTGAVYWIDGQRLDGGGPVELSLGEHLLQVRGDRVTTFRFELESGDSTLYVPAAASAALLETASAPAGRAELEMWLARVLPRGTTLYVLTGEQIWRTTVGTWRWVDVPAEFAALRVATRRRVDVGWDVARVGAVATGIGVAISALSWGFTMRAYRKANLATNQADFDSYYGTYYEWRPRVALAQSSLLIGVGSVGIGLSLTRFGRWPLRARVAPDVILEEDEEAP